MQSDACPLANIVASAVNTISPADVCDSNRSQLQITLSLEGSTAGTSIQNIICRRARHHLCYYVSFLRIILYSLRASETTSLLTSSACRYPCLRSTSAPVTDGCFCGQDAACCCSSGSIIGTPRWEVAFLALRRRFAETASSDT